MRGIPTITRPICLTLAAGFLALRLGQFSKPDLRVIGHFVIDFCVPALRLRSGVKWHSHPNTSARKRRPT